MGLYDRDYYPQQNDDRSEPKSAVFLIVVLNVAIWLANSLFFPPTEMTEMTNSITSRMALRPTDLFEPTQYYRFLTYGFAHADNFNHVMFNMLTLFFLGPLVEQRYGRREFLCFYLVAIVVGGLFWAGTTYSSLASELHTTEVAKVLMANGYALPSCVGASGAVTAMLILFTFNFPHEKLLLFFVIPMPAWVLGFLIVGLDLLGAQQTNTNVAHSVHLAGAAFALLYYLSGIRFTGLFGASKKTESEMNDFGPRPYQSYRDEDYEEDDSYGYSSPSPLPRTAEEIRSEQEMQKLEQEVEELLRKISQFGMQSLTPSELKKLQEASRVYKKRR